MASCRQPLKWEVNCGNAFGAERFGQRFSGRQHSIVCGPIGHMTPTQGLAVTGIEAGGSPPKDAPEGKINIQPASRRTAAISLHNVHASLTPMVTAPLNSCPANWRIFSAIRARCPSDNNRGAFNLSSSTCASSAFELASAARASNWASCLSPATRALFPKTTSAHTPPTISKTAAISAIVSGPLYQITAFISSRTRPAMSTYAARCARCELTSYCRPGSSSPSLDIVYITSARRTSSCAIAT